MTIEVPLRRLFRVVNGGTPTSDPVNWDGGVEWATPIDLAICNGSVLSGTQRTLTLIGLQSGSTEVPAGSLLLSTRAPIGYVAQTARPAAFNQGCRALVPQVDLDIRYYRYVLTAMKQQLVSAGQGSTFVELSSEGLAGTPVPLLPFAAQRAIADYLDTETARIDALIAKKQQLASRLAEHFAALVEEIIWSGCDERMPLMHRTQLARPIMYGIVLPGPDVAEGVPIVKGGDVSAGRLSPDQLSRTTFDIEAPYARARLRGGDLVFAIRGGVGDVRVVPAELSGANITQDVARVAPAPDVDPTWLLLVLKTLSVQAEAAERTTGATIRGLNIWELKRLGMPISSPARQRDDLAVLGPAQERHDRSRSALHRQIELLREHRQALITAAVTGELEIAGVA